MSAFTSFGAPGCQGPSTKDITQLIDAYTQMQTAFNAHVNSDAANTPVHGVSTAIASKADNSDLSELSGTVNSLAVTVSEKADSADVYTKGDVDTKLAGKANSSTVGTLSATVGALESAVAGKANAANVYDKTEVYTKAEVNAALAEKADIPDADGSKIVVDNELEFKFKLTTLQYAGTGAANDTGTHGIYVVGKIADVGEGLPKSARVFIKYVNTHPFDAVIDLTVTHDENDKANVMALVSRSEDVNNEGEHYWNGLRFHVLHITDNQSHDNYYLGLSADNVAESVLAMYVAGINFIPLSEEGAPSISALGDCVDHTTRIPDAATSALLLSSTLAIEALSLNEITDTDGASMFKVTVSDGKKYLEIGSGADDKIRFRARPTAYIGTDPEHMAEHAFITDEEAENFCSTPVGGIILWPKFIVHEDGGQVIGREAQNPPDGWVVCYGDPVATAEYPDLVPLVEAGILTYTDASHNFIQLPKMDYAIMKAKKPTFDNIVPEIPVAPDVAQLASDVATLTTRLESEITVREEADTAHSEAIATINDTTIPTAQATAEANALAAANAQLGLVMSNEVEARVEGDSTVLAFVEDKHVYGSVDELPRNVSSSDEWHVDDTALVFNGVAITTYKVTAVTQIAADNYQVDWELVNA